MLYEKLFLNSLLVTTLIEVPVVFILVCFVYKKKNISDIIFVSALASALTLPYFWFIFPMYVSNRTIYILLGESIIVFVEATLYWRLLKLTFLQAIVISLIANSASALTMLI